MADMTDVSDVMMDRASQQLQQCVNRLRVATDCLQRAPSGSRPRDWTPEVSIMQGMRKGMQNMCTTILDYMSAKQQEEQQ